MKQLSFINRLRIGSIGLTLIAASLALFSFNSKKIAEDFLQQLGISKASADEKITNSLLGGYLDQYGLKNAKNIAIGNRTAVANSLLAYTKEYTNSDAFQKEYRQLRENNKPQPQNVQTPEEMRTVMIEQYKKSLTETEANMKKAGASMKSIFEPVIATIKQQLKEVEDPNNKMIANYKKSYPDMMKSMEAGNKQRLAEWEQKYPSNQQLFIKRRLQQFLEETGNIDFDAELVEKNGKKYFVNPAYEHKGNRWKLAFRAGKEVIEPARTFVQKWIDEIK